MSIHFQSVAGKIFSGDNGHGATIFPRDVVLDEFAKRLAECENLFEIVRHKIGGAVRAGLLRLLCITPATPSLKSPTSGVSSV